MVLNQVNQGRWGRLSVQVNSSRVMDYEGEVCLEIKGNQIDILPAGLRFSIDEWDGSNAILTTRGKRYLGSIEFSEDRVLLRMRGVDSSEEMVVAATFSQDWNSCESIELVDSIDSIEV